MTLQGIDYLLAKDAIQTTMNDYVLGMDLRNPNRFLSAWHEDGVWEMNCGAGGGPVRGEGHDGLLAAVQSLWHDQRLSLHMTGNHEIKFVDEDHATAEGHASVLGVGVNGRAFLCGAVYVADRLERRDGVWRFAYRRNDVNTFTEIKEEASILQLFDGFGGALLDPRGAVQ